MTRTTGALAIALLSTTAASRADDVQAAAAKVFAEQKGHTISMSVTRKRGSKDVTFDAQGLSLDGKGIVVTALSAIEPPVNAMMAAAARAAGGAVPGKGELSKLSIYAPDGSEVDAEVLLTDPDLDLAFIKVKPGEDGDALELAAPVPASAKAEVLDDVLGIQRMSASFQREASVALIEISAVVETPRLLYVPSAAIRAGTAVFNLKGELVGIGARKGGTTVVLPTKTLLKLAATVPEKAAEE